MSTSGPDGSRAGTGPDTGSGSESDPGSEAFRPHARPALPAFEQAVRADLGCACAPEVFAEIEHDPGPVEGLPGIERRIAIGGRLLIYVAEPADPASVAAQMAGWVAAGVAERDRRRMQRLRLVVGLDPFTPELAYGVESAFSRLPALAAQAQPRVYLHCLPAVALAPFRTPV